MPETDAQIFGSTAENHLDVIIESYCLDRVNNTTLLARKVFNVTILEKVKIFDSVAFLVLHTFYKLL